MPARSRRLLDRFALARAEGVGIATVDRWINEGLPVARRGVRGHLKTLLDRDVARTWRRAAKAGHNDPATLRLLAASTGLVGGELAKLQAEWIPAEQGERIAEALVDVLEPILRAWPAAAAAALAPALAEGLHGAALAYRIRDGVVRTLQAGVAGVATSPEALVARAGLAIETPAGRAPEPQTTRAAKAQLLDARGALAEARLALRRGTWRPLEDVRRALADCHARAVQVFTTSLPGSVAMAHAPDVPTLQRLFEAAVTAALDILRGRRHDDRNATTETTAPPDRRRAARAPSPRVGAHARGARRRPAPAQAPRPVKRRRGAP